MPLIPLILPGRSAIPGVDRPPPVSIRRVDSFVEIPFLAVVPVLLVLIPLNVGSVRGAAEACELVGGEGLEPPTSSV
jgi:hypothetical protein